MKPAVKSFFAMSVPNAVLRLVSPLLPVDRRARLPAPARLVEVTGQAREVTFVMLRPDRCVIAKELFWGRGRRPRAQDDLAVQVFATIAERSDVVIDVGAYTGLFTLVGTAVNPALRAHAFEIVPEVHRLLVANCERNGVAGRVTAHLEGIGAPGAAMTVPSGAGGSALPDFYSSRLRFDEGVRIGFRSLDSLADVVPRGARVLVKVDVEGTEPDVFEHGQAFLAAFRPDILCEVLPELADSGVLERLLAPHGYAYHLVEAHALVPRRRIEPDARFRDWFFTTDPAALAERARGSSASR
jgi:FkbM family methyltransferase